jgi:nucleoside-diphosphate-sugar epimerase
MKTPQLRALITGTAGWVGFNLCKLWLAKYGPQSVVALTGPVQHETERRRLGQLRQWPLQRLPIDLRRRPVLGGGQVQDFDVLFHLAAYVRTEDDASDVRINDNGTRWLLEELGERLRNKHLVFTSSISAVDTTRAKGGWMDAGTECCPRTEYGRSKLNAERIIKAQSVRLGFTYSILRLPIVYGPGYRPGGMFEFFREQLPKKTLGSRLPWPGRISIVAVGDVANILAEAAVREEMRGRTFFVSSAEDPSMADMARVAATCLGVNYKPLPIGKGLFCLMGTVGRVLCCATFLRHSLRIWGWRVSLVVDGFCCDGTELTAMLDMRYLPWSDSFHRMFELPPPMASTPSKDLVISNPSQTA